MTAIWMNAARYSNYFGIDIPDAALENARKESAKKGRSGQNLFSQGDMGTWSTDRKST
jgi:hypothetical protein